MNKQKEDMTCLFHISSTHTNTSFNNKRMTFKDLSTEHSFQEGVNTLRNKAQANHKKRIGKAWQMRLL